MNYTHITVIVKSENRVNAQELTSSGYFNAEASADGLAPATHYFMSGPFNNDEVDALVNAPFEKWIRSEDWQGALAGLGLMPVVSTEPTI